jgi:hypothetical protein
MPWRRGVFPLLAFGLSCAPPAARPEPFPCSTVSAREPLHTSAPGKGSGIVTLRIQDARSGDLVTHATVRLLEAKPRLREYDTQPADSGMVMFAGVLPGRYYLTSAAVGYYQRLDTLDVAPGGLAVTAQLEPIGAQTCPMPRFEAP